MSSRQEQELCARMYSRRSKLHSIKKAEAYEQWLQEYLPFAHNSYKMVIENVKGVNPDFDTFCRFIYKSCKCNFDFERLADT